MNPLSFQDIIKIIPLEKEMRENLQKNFDSFDEDRKLNVRQICWDAFIELKDALTDLKYQQYMQEVELGKRDLYEGIMDDAKAAVWQDFLDILSGKKAEVEKIDEIRSKLQSLIKLSPSDTSGVT